MMSDAQTVSVISFNASGVPSPPLIQLRLKEIARQIEATDALIVNLQEIYTYKLVTILKKHLVSYAHVAFAPSLVGPKAGLITFSKLPVGETSFESLFRTTRKLAKSFMLSRSSFDSLTKGILITKLNNSTVVVNVHLSANTDGDWSQDNRFYKTHQAQLNVLQAICQRYNDSTVILSGDFNVAKDCGLYECFLQQGRWFDPFRDDMSPTFHAEFLSSDRQPRRIDYILAKNTALPELIAARSMFDKKVTLNGKLETHLSNHKGLYAKLSLD